MDREGFLDAIKKQYADEIHEAYLECEHEDGRRIELTQLERHLVKLMAHAKVEGLSNKDFIDLVKSTLPDIWEKLDFTGTQKAA